MNFTKITKLTIAIAMMVIISNPLASTGLNIPVNVQVGDKFSFRVVDLTNSEMVNGTEYATEIDDIAINDVIEIEVTNVADGEVDGLFSGEDGVVISADETVNGNTTEVQSGVNAWTNFFYIGIFIIAFSGFGFPEGTTFEEPEPDTDDDDDDSLDPLTGMPVFTTSNASFYDEFLADLDLIEANEIKGQNSTRTVVSGDLNTVDDIFTFSTIYNIVEVGSYLGMDTYFETYFEFVIEIDYSRSIVTSFYFEIGLEERIGDGSAKTSVAVGIAEGAVNDNENPLPLLSLPLALFSIAFVAIFVRRIRK